MTLRRPRLDSLARLALLLLFLALPTLARTEPYPVLRQTASGTADEIGAAVGRANAATIREMHRLFLNLAQQESHATRDAIYEQAAAIGKSLSEEDVACIKGLATASGLA